MTDTIDHTDAPADTDVADAPAPDSPDIEALAMEAGWKPADQWKGEGHMPARDFLKHQVARAKEKADEVKSINKRMDRLAKTSASIMERQLREQREELEGRYADLVAANKPAEARRISQQIDQLEQADSPDDVADDFKARNAAWFEKDEAATALAFVTCQKAANAGKSYEEQLEAAEAAVKKRFPDLFGEPAALQRKAPVVGVPATRATGVRTKGFTAETLPTEARASLRGFLSKINDPQKHPAFTKRYLEEYNRENGQ